jgi:hypothetical protein
MFLEQIIMFFIQNTWLFPEKLPPKWLCKMPETLYLFVLLINIESRLLLFADIEPAVVGFEHQRRVAAAD